MSTEFPTDYNYLFKIILLGDPVVGKSYILSQYIREDFDLENKNTIGVEFDQKFFPTKPGQPKILVQLWDSAGQDAFLSTIPQFFRAAVGALIIFDVTKYNTFLNCEKWYNKLKEMADEEIQILLVGNKTDLNNLRIVSPQEAQAFADQRNMHYIEVSALTGENVEEAIALLVQDVLKIIQSKDPNTVMTNKTLHLRHNVDVSKRNQCCGTGGMV